VFTQKEKITQQEENWQEATLAGLCCNQLHFFVVHEHKRVFRICSLCLRFRKMRIQSMKRVLVYMFCVFGLSLFCLSALNCGGTQDNQPDEKVTKEAVASQEPGESQADSGVADTTASPVDSDISRDNDTPADSDAPDQANGFQETYDIDANGVAVKGYDVVAYFEQQQPVKGTPTLSITWSGAIWYFSSEAHRKLFLASPQKYAPQYGGYCAWAVSRGYTASIDPNAWKIVDQKLYLNFSLSVQKQWEQDIPGNIALADKNWPALRRKP
jgi:YHS domain-containing protein